MRKHGSTGTISLSRASPNDGQQPTAHSESLQPGTATEENEMDTTQVERVTQPGMKAKLHHPESEPVNMGYGKTGRTAAKLCDDAPL